MSEPLKTYTLMVTIKEGSDEFWESLADKSGVDEIVEKVRECLADRGFVEPDCIVGLVRFTNE